MRGIVVDLALAAFVLAGAGLLFYGSSGLPPPRFEPMGSAAVPRILASLLVLFAIILSASAVRRYFSGINTKASEQSSPSSVSNSNTESESASSSNSAVAADTAAASTTSSSAVRAIILFAALVGYVFALDRMQWPFVPVTAAFVTFAGSLLSRPALRTVIIFFLFGLVLSYSVHTVFTRFLYVDLG